MGLSMDFLQQADDERTCIFRERAANMLRLAEDVPSMTAKAVYLSIARGYGQLASGTQLLAKSKLNSAQ
jgi:hypothetical protein